MAQWQEHSPPNNVAWVSILVIGVTCGLRLLLVLILAQKDFSPGTPVFFSLQNTNISLFQFDLDTVDEEPLRRCATANSHLFY